MNRLKQMGESVAWRLMVGAAIQGATEQGYELRRQPGRGLSNTYLMTKGGETKTVSIRTTRDRWFAFPPLDGGKRWKTLDDVEMVLVSAVDDRNNPQNVDVYLFPADEVRRRFDESYAARVGNGHTIRDNYGMWVMLDEGDETILSQVGSGLAKLYPAIARYTLDELEEGAARSDLAADEPPEEGREAEAASAPQLATVADVLSFARDRIAALTGMPLDAIKLNLKMGV